MSTTPTSLTAPGTLTGVSKYSTDLQSILTRAVAIAKLPLTRLQNEDSDLLQKAQQLSTLGSAVSGLGTSLTTLGKLAKNKALFGTSSDSSVATVQATGATSATSYAITNVTSLAAAASETSKLGYADSSAASVSSTGTLNLVMGAKSYPITLTPAQNNLTGLRDAINNLGVGVTASVLTTGTGVNPNYLSVSAASTGATTLQINDDPTGANTNLLTSSNQGADAIFKLNGLSVDRPSNTVNDVAPGATFTIRKLSATGQTVTLTLASDPSQLQSGLQAFADSYNALVDAVHAQVGPAAGLLGGDFIVRQVQSNLRQLTSYRGGGPIQSLSDLGIQLGADGKITFDTTVLNSLSDSQISSAFDFVGSTTTGLGGLSQAFNQLTDPITGLIKAQQDSYLASDARLQGNISDLSGRISRLQASLTLQLQAADALQAQLESQQNQLNATIQSLNYTSFGASSSTSNTVG